MHWPIQLVMMVLPALSILNLPVALADSEPDEIVALDLLTVKEPRSQAESQLRVIRLTARSGAAGYGDYLDFGLPAENAEETLTRLVNRYAAIAPHFFSYGPLTWVAMANLCMATPNVLILEANTLRENPSGPKGLNKNQFFKEPIKIDGYYFTPSGKPGLGYEYDEKFVVSRKRLA